MANKVFSVEQLRLNGRLLSGHHESPYNLYYGGTELAYGPAIPGTRQLIAGDGLGGGGDLSADRTIHVNAGSGIYVAASDFGAGAGQVAARDKVHIDKDGVVTEFIKDANVTNAKLANSSLTVAAGNGIQGGGLVSLGNTTTINVKAKNTWFEFAGTELAIKADSITKTEIESSVAGSGLHVQPDGALYVLTDADTLKITDGTDILKVRDGGINTTQLATDSVTSVKIKDDNVITSKILDANVTNAKLANSVTNFTFASGITGVAASTTQSTALGGTQTIQVAINKTQLEVAGNNQIGIKAGGIGNTELGVNYAGSASKGGAATSVANALTNGDGIGTLSFDGSAAKTVAVDNTVVRTAGTQTIDGLKTWVQNATFNSGVTIAGNLVVNGTTTTVVSNEVNIGDSNILLNSDIVDDANNSNGGISVKRLHTDDSTRKDAILQWNEANDSWEAGYAGTNYEILTKGKIERGTVALAKDLVEKTITFANGYSATPTVVVTMQGTADTDDLIGCMTTSVSSTVAKVQFTTKTPNTNYKINYVVMGF